MVLLLILRDGKMGDLAKRPVGSSKPPLSSFSEHCIDVSLSDARATTFGPRIAYLTPLH